MKKNISKFIEHTNYSPTCTRSQVRKLCQEAVSFSFGSVCVNLNWVKYVKQKFAKDFRRKKIRISAIIDFPLGADGLESKIYQAKLAKKYGADEIDTVLNLGNLLDRQYDLTKKEIGSINSILPSKFIVEHSVLSNNQLTKIADIINDHGATLKLASGFIPSDHRKKIEHIKLIRKHFPALRIKASGGIKSIKEINQLLKAGASVIGTSSAIRMLGKIKKNNR
jgi:deoxyribose-phosphate aldolase